MLKKIMYILIIVILVLFIVSAFSWSSIGNKISAMNEKSNNENKINSNECQEFISNILPKKIELTKMNDAILGNSFEWGDGTMGSISFLRNGARTGENQSHLYSVLSITYNKQPISEDGIIGKPVEVIFSYWELEIISNEKPTANYSMKIVDAKIVNYDVAKCEIS